VAASALGRADAAGAACTEASMKVAVISANLGGYDAVVPWPEQEGLPPGVTVDVHRLDDRSFQGRDLAMTSRLKCGIPKWFGAELFPGYDVYLWVDASRALAPDTVAWFLNRLGMYELALFLHPERMTIRQEYEFIKARLQRPGETYLNSRYAGEWLEAQYRAVSKPWHIDNRLYASTAFAYRPTLTIQRAFKEVWHHKSRYLLHDQLALPYAVREHRVKVLELPENIYTLPQLPITRQKRGGAQALVPPKPVMPANRVVREGTY
jgi:hypothetical protein